MVDLDEIVARNRNRDFNALTTTSYAITHPSVTPKTVEEYHATPKAPKEKRKVSKRLFMTALMLGMIGVSAVGAFIVSSGTVFQQPTGCAQLHYSLSPSQSSGLDNVGLKNIGTTAIQITNIAISNGGQSITGEDGKPYPFPFTLNAGASQQAIFYYSTNSGPITVTTTMTLSGHAYTCSNTIP